MGFGHGGAACGGVVGMLPDVEEDAGASGGEVVEVVLDDEARAVDPG